MRKLAAFILRDFSIETSYRFSFLFQLASILFTLGSWYFLSRFVGDWPAVERALYGGDYFAFVLVAVALSDYQATAMDAFARSIRESQIAGTLEALVSTPTPLWAIVLYSAAYPFLWTTVVVLAYLGLGVAFFDLALAPSSWAGAMAVLALSLAAFAGLGILSASMILVFKRGTPVAWLFAALSMLLSGVLYPVSVLPGWLRPLAEFLPLTHAVRGMRAALLPGGTWSELSASLGALALFATLVLPLGLYSFAWATRQARIAGTLGHS